jgi:agmatinase
VEGSALLLSPILTVVELSPHDDSSERTHRPTTEILFDFVVIVEGTKMKSNLPPDSLDTPRFCGIPTFMRLDQTRDVDHVDVAVVGIPSDSGSGYRTGARFGPNAIRQMSVMLRPINPYQGNINIFELCKIVDFGDVNVVPGYVEETFERITSAMDVLVERGIIPVGLGGDHLVTLPELRSVAKRHGKVALLHDSHTDIGILILRVNGIARDAL